MTRLPRQIIGTDIAIAKYVTFSESLKDYHPNIRMQQDMIGHDRP
jgi:hypothetical protein